MVASCTGWWGRTAQGHKGTLERDKNVHNVSNVTVTRYLSVCMKYVHFIHVNYTQ